MKEVVRGFILIFLLAVVSASSAVAQSSDQLFPTPVRSSEIVSTIKARDIGDSRLTTYYYTFEGEQGDVFLNVQSKNFTGDIDLFVVPGQVPLTKIVIYGDQPETETGRVVYLRKPERLLLRVQGRTPGDDEASIKIKFAGSFAASKLDDSAAPSLPTVESTSETNVRVNSVGTILEVIPKLKPTPEVVAEKVEPPTADTTASEKAEEDTTEKKSEVAAETRDDSAAKRESDAPPPKLEVAVTDPVVEEKKRDPPRTTGRNTRRRNTRNTPPAKAAEDAEAETKKEETPPATTRARRSAARKSPAKVEAKTEDPKTEEEKVDPMAGIRLVVYFKDGSTIERPMTEVQRFAVEKAVLTIISRDGSVGRYQMIDIQRVSIE
ncbi:MAG TPA: hypothetical protein VFZ49_01635 [Pyrinomonadaceae bacterium]